MVEVTIVDYTLKVLATNYFVEQFPCKGGIPYHVNNCRYKNYGPPL